MATYIEILKKDPLVYYIYQMDLSIYGIQSEQQKYLVVVDSKYQIPKELRENAEFVFFNTEEWFVKVLNCEILAWQCSCLNRKFIIKEHVKLVLSTDALKLRQNFKAMMDPYFLVAMSKISNGDFVEGKLKLLDILKEAEFSNQILDFHKIINYGIIKSYYDQLMETENDEEKIIAKFMELQAGTVSLLIRRTDSLIQNNKLKKITNE
jgi:hypothetical protein